MAYQRQYMPAKTTANPKKKVSIGQGMRAEGNSTGPRKESPNPADPNPTPMSVEPRSRVLPFPGLCRPSGPNSSKHIQPAITSEKMRV